MMFSFGDAWLENREMRLVCAIAGLSCRAEEKQMVYPVYTRTR
jgi:hypothetical protein